jgi:hypothetical protein
MANGSSSALKILALDPPADPPTGIQEGIEATIGQATAAVATAFCLGADEYMAGALTPATREAGGARVEALYWLQAAHAGKIDFPLIARREGARVLRGYLDGIYQQHPAAGEEMIDIALSTVLDILNRVTAATRAWVN